MAEGRRSQVVLLDNHTLEILIQPKLYAGELLDMVASHFNLKEKEYFGLAFLDDTDHYSWLSLDRRVFEHEFPKRSSLGPIILYFLVKYFVESITLLRDTSTVETFYLQAKSLVFKGIIETDSETAFQLAALALQVSDGDYIDEDRTNTLLKKLAVLPTSVFKEHPSLQICKDKVIGYYKKLLGQSRGEAIVNYMSIVESLPTYGIHFYKVKDKGGIPWWLGLNYKGISQYDFVDRKNPRKIFPWKHLDNLYFRDKKFSVEVHSPRRVVHALSSFNLYEDAIEEPLENLDELSDAITDPTTLVSVSRRTFGPGNVTVYVWFASDQALAKCIWSMAVAQHQFYLDKKHCKSRVSIFRSLAEIATDLSHSVQSLSSVSSTSNLSRSTSSHSLPTLRTEGKFNFYELISESHLTKQDMLGVLKARKEALEETLKKKIEDLRALCIKEGELTGELPPEMPLAPGELPPTIRRRVGTTFTLNDKLISKAKFREEEALEKLELQYEIQSKITSAALQLANDVSATKTVRKQRRAACLQSQKKMEDLEKRLEVLRKQTEGLRAKCTKHSSDGEASEDSMSHSTDDNEMGFPEKSVNLSDLNITLSPRPNKLEEANNQVNRVLAPIKVPSPVPSSSSSSLQLSATPNSAPPSPIKSRQSRPVYISGSSTMPPDNPFSRSCSSRGSSHSLGNQRSKNRPVYHSRPSSHNEHYTRPGSQSTVSAGSDSYDNISIGGGSGSFLRSPYQNRFESSLNLESSNLYSVPTQRTSQALDTQDDMLVLSPSEVQDLGLMSRHNSLETRHRNSVRQHKTRHASENIPCRPTVKVSPSYDDRHCYLRPLEESQRAVNTLPYHHHHHSSYHHSKKHHSSSKPDSRSLDSLAYHPDEDYPVFDDHPTSQESLEHSISENKLGNIPLTQSAAQYKYVETLHVSEPELNHTVRNKQTVDSQGVHQSVNKISSFPCYLNTLSPKLYKDIYVYDDSTLGQFSLKDAQIDEVHAGSSHNLSPKPKTKDWVETSLDSPLPPRKSKFKENRISSSSGVHPPVAQLISASAEPQEPVNNLSQHKEEFSVVTGTQVAKPQVPFISKPTSRSSTENTLSPHKAVIMENNLSFSPPPPSFSSHQAGIEVNVVSMGHFQPYWEETKPYEISDFYKYSTKHRKQNSASGQHANLSNLHANTPGQHPGQASFASEMLLGPEPDSAMNQLSPVVINCYKNQQRFEDPSPQNSPQKEFCEPLLSPQSQTVHSLISPIPVDPELSTRITESALTLETSFSFEEPASCISLAQDFHQEMLEWYEDQDSVKKATLV
ncbi:uncharacterized protein LOC143236454 isoform X3 [Tachypleus tridentatus]